MFDIGWSEMAIIAVLALVVLGPKELPGALRTLTGLMRQARKLTSEFRSGVNEIIREADLEEARQKLQSVSKGSIAREIEKTVDPEGSLKAAMNAPDKAPDKPQEKAAVERIADLGPASASPPIADPAPMADAEIPAVLPPQAEVKPT